MKGTSPLSTVARSVFALLLLGVAAQTPADPAPARFRTELEAVVSAAGHYNPRSIREDREFMGAILRRDDCYTYTVGAGEPGHDRITVRIEIPVGAEVVAFWHTHGGKQHRHRYFSAVDTALVEAWQKRFYLADFTGRLKVMAPGAPRLSPQRARKLRLPAGSGYARGRILSDAQGKPIRIATRE